MDVEPIESVASSIIFGALIRAYLRTKTAWC
jgi:hypothetical protein